MADRGAQPGSVIASAPARNRWRQAALAASVAGAAACTTVVVLSFLPFVPPLPAAVSFVLFAGLFPVHARSAILLRRRRIASASARAAASALAERYWWLWLAGLLAAVSFFTALPSLQGQPTIVHGAYFLDDHGSLIPVSHGAYVRALDAQERLFTGIACVFYAVGAAVNGRRSSSR